MRDLARKVADYYTAARHRAERRKSAWNVLLIPFCFGAWLGIWYLLFRLVWQFHVFLYPQHRLEDFLDHTGRISIRSFICGLLMLFAPLVGAMVLGFMLGNVVFWLITPIRRIFDAEARGYPGTSFRDSMRVLFKVGVWALPIGLALAFTGAYFLNSLW